MIKIAVLALVGSANAFGEIFFSPTIKKDPVPVDITYKKMKFAVGDGKSKQTTMKVGVCQLLEGTQLYNFKHLDNRIRDVGKEKAAEIALNSQIFTFKTCNAAFELAKRQPIKPPATMKIGTEEQCKKPSYAFSAVDGTCKINYGKPKAQFLYKLDASSQREKFSSGWQLEWTSVLPDATKKVQLNVLCDPYARKQKQAADKDVAFTWKDQTQVNTETDGVTKFNYFGTEGCAEVNLADVLGPITKFSGVIFLGLGIFLCFFGCYFVRTAFCVLSFLASTVLTFAIIYNLGFIKALNEGKLGAYIGVIAAASVVGILCALFAYRCLWKHAAPLLGAIGAGALMGLLLAPISALKSYMKVGAIILSGVCGWFIANKFKKEITKGVTAFIGAFLIFKGIGSFAGGFPSFAMDSMKGNTTSPIFWAYLAGIFIFGGVGFFVQLKYFPEFDDENYYSDAMDAQQYA